MATLVATTAARKSATGEQLFGPREMMRGLAGSRLPKGIQLAVLTYYFEAKPQELFGRVRYYFQTAPWNDQMPPDGLAVFIDYEKVDRLFQNLTQFGEEYGLQAFAKGEIFNLLEPRYVIEAPLAYGTDYICHEKTPECARWKFHLPEEVEKEHTRVSKPHSEQLISRITCSQSVSLTVKITREVAFDAGPVVGELARLQELIKTQMNTTQQSGREVTLKLEEIPEYAVNDLAVSREVQEVQRRHLGAARDFRTDMKERAVCYGLVLLFHALLMLRVIYSSLTEE
jgi:hypothetical protein